ncbi:alpha/beta-hydrolase [Sistotremastrum suecicum HHB10207 ss-3]|uniref:Alpha/beta-hydrolase n=1 Tax=Sistotremastrum suecicum HHB10207 ss-3 TaxID=1314776 RepID=A0A165ZSR1_9AGAM|nr:alpha/beta-hydrolase [Sistotremastrum suecicum HHB10207 ss-3]
MSSAIEPFVINVPDSQLEDLQTRLSMARFPVELALSPGQEWSYGTPEQKVRELVHHWRTTFDWRKIESEINAQLPQFVTEVDSGGEDHGRLKVHFVHRRSSRMDAIPLLFIHGWPGNFLEVSKIIAQLVEPTNAQDPAFHVVAPSLPGYCFSEASTKPGLDLKVTAYMFNELMNKLRYKSYIAQGGDWGAMLIRGLAIWHPERCKGVHTNMFVTHPPTPLRSPFKLFKLIVGFLGLAVGWPIWYSAEELEPLKNVQQFVDEETGYLELQSRKPQTLAYGLTDSPVGLLGWMYEKLHGWTDDYPWTNDEILTWVMLYWIPGPVGSVRYYKESVRVTDWRTYCLKTWSPVPMGVSVFPKELFVPPHDWAEMVGPVIFYKRHKSGGHFAAWERPNQLIDDIQRFTEKLLPSYWSGVDSAVGTR